MDIRPRIYSIGNSLCYQGPGTQNEDGTTNHPLGVRFATFEETIVNSNPELIEEIVAILDKYYAKAEYELVDQAITELRQSSR